MGFKHTSRNHQLDDKGCWNEVAQAPLQSLSQAQPQTHPAPVMMNGEPANGTLDWSVNATLAEGENTITVVVTDGEGFTTTAAVTVRGDLNSDGSLTLADAAIALAIAASGAHNDAADVSGDDRVTSLDALMILQAAGGAITI
ncbi:MAG: hypothetical protein GQ567_02595 [Methanosarcinales archaeon]|nr:hypothetical protein [Methanosarcinales archaeon]